MLGSEYWASTLFLMRISPKPVAYSCCYLDWRLVYYCLSFSPIGRDKLLLRVFNINHLFHIAFPIDSFIEFPFINFQSHFLLSEPLLFFLSFDFLVLVQARGLIFIFPTRTLVLFASVAQLGAGVSALDFATGDLAGQHLPQQIGVHYKLYILD